MKRSALVGSLLLVIMILGCIKFKREQLFAPQGFDAEITEPKKIGDDTEDKDSETIEEHLGPIKSQDQQKNLEGMVEVLFRYSKKEAKLSTLLTYLSQSEQSPFMVQDADMWTDGLIIVRTQKPFVGTRYFHAQYFYDENKVPYLQHMSFEFRPGSDSMQRAIEAVKAHADRVTTPYIESDDFIAWRLEAPLQIYIKRLDCFDLQYHPYNAYSKRDIGTIKIAVEIDPHLEGLEGEELEEALVESAHTPVIEDALIETCELPAGPF